MVLRERNIRSFVGPFPCFITSMGFVPLLKIPGWQGVSMLQGCLHPWPHISPPKRGEERIPFILDPVTTRGYHLCLRSLLRAINSRWEFRSAHQFDESNPFIGSFGFQFNDHISPPEISVVSQSESDQHRPIGPRLDNLVIQTAPGSFREVQSFYPLL